MADRENNTSGPSGDDQIDDDEARQLLNQPKPGEERKDDGEDEDPEGADQLGDPGRKALESIKASRQKARDRATAAEKERDAALAKVREYETAGQSESERMQGERDSYKTRAEKAEALQRRFEIAASTAPDHATIAQLRKVAKRLSGDTDDALTEDAEELWGDMAPAPPKAPAGKPKERLRGGGDPDDGSDDITDPEKLAALVSRRR